MENNKIKVSFIVPCYNVENYILNCANSILSQKNSDIELILVDDGSTDSTLQIIDEIKQKDIRVAVIHKENGGVSKARNVGISIAKGEFVTFVDGDDYISADYTDYMLNLIENEKADFAISKNCYLSKKEKQVKNDRIQLLSAKEAVALLLAPIVKVGCWNKIYRRDFLLRNDIKFNEKLFYGEGLSFIVNVAQRCNVCVVGEKKVYYYRRNNPTSACTVFDIQKVYNGEKSLEKIKDELIISDKQITKMLILHRCIYNAGAITKLRLNKVTKEYKQDDKRWRSYNRRKTLSIFFMKKASLYRKVLVLTSWLFPNFLSVLEKKRRKKIATQSIE